MIHTVGRSSASKEIHKKLPALLMIFALIFTSGCEKKAVNNANNAADMTDVYDVTSSLGMKTDDVLNKYDSVTEDKENSGIYKFNRPVNNDGIDVNIELEFLNEKLFRVKYDFGANTEVAISFVQKLNSEIIAKYGESDTYKYIYKDSSEKIEGLTADTYLNSDDFEYKEYWEDTDVTFDDMVPEEYINKKKIDLGIGITKVPTEPIKNIVYIGGIVNNVNAVN